MYAGGVEGTVILKDILAIDPGFRSVLVEQVELWLDSTGGVSGEAVLRLLARFVGENLRENRHEETEPFFNRVERWLERTDGARDLVASNFLNPLAADSGAPAESYVWKLGPKTYELLRKKEIARSEPDPREIRTKGR